MTKKKPDIYTKTGRAKKPAAPKGLTAEYAQAVKRERVLHSSKHLHDLLKNAKAINDAREKFYEAIIADVAKRTIKLWFGYSLVRPPAKK